MQSNDPLFTVVFVVYLVKQTTHTEMEAPMILVKTVNNIYQYFGFEGEINDYIIFREPRLSRKNHDKCDLCFPLIHLGGSTASVSCELLFPEYKVFRIQIDVEKVMTSALVLLKIPLLQLSALAIFSNFVCRCRRSFHV